MLFAVVVDEGIRQDLRRQGVREHGRGRPREGSVGRSAARQEALEDSYSMARETRPSEGEQDLEMTLI
jgi:hypothetical protein